VEAWYRAQGVDRTAEEEGAKEKLLAKLGARGELQEQGRAETQE
jgi:hypothetical protein